MSFRSLVFGLMLTQVVVCEDGMTGRWSGTMGVVIIPAGSGSFDLKIAEQHYPARWVAAGKEFSWTDRQGKRHQATLEPNPKATPERPTRIRDVGEAYPDSPAFWYRVP